jgi:hypothetical protein
MADAVPALHPHRFSRAEYCAIADSLDPSRRYELLDGTIYAMGPAKPPHAGVVKFFANRFRALDALVFQISVQDVLKSNPTGRRSLTSRFCASALTITARRTRTAAMPCS